MKKSAIILSIVSALALALALLACNNSDPTSESVPAQRGSYQATSDFTVVTPTSIQLPDGWWDPIDEKSLEQIQYSLLGISMWGNCAWYADNPSPGTEAAVRSSLSKVIDSPVADSIGVIESADLNAVCEGSAAIADFPIEVQDGRRAAFASDMMIDLIDSCVTFYDTPEPALAYRIAITFMDMLWMLELDSPRWPRRDYWGVREWCDNVVEGAVAS